MLFIYLQLLDGFGAKQPKCLLSSCYSSAYWDQVSYTTDRQQHRRITFASNPPQGQLDQSLPPKIKTVLLSDGACAPGKLLLFLMPFEIRRTRDLSMKWMCIFKKGGGRACWLVRWSWMTHILWLFFYYSWLQTDEATCKRTQTPSSICKTHSIPCFVSYTDVKTHWPKDYLLWSLALL